MVARAVALCFLMVPPWASAQTGLTDLERRSMIVTALEHRRGLIRDTAVVDACSVYLLVGQVDTTVRSIQARVRAPRVEGPYGPGCALPDERAVNRVIFKEFRHWPTIPDTLTNRHWSVPPGGPGQVATLTAFVIGASPVADGYYETYTFFAAPRTASSTPLRWFLWDVRLYSFAQR